MFYAKMVDMCLSATSEVFFFNLIFLVLFVIALQITTFIVGYLTVQQLLGCRAAVKTQRQPGGHFLHVLFYSVIYANIKSQC